MISIRWHSQHSHKHCWTILITHSSITFQQHWDSYTFFFSPFALKELWTFQSCILIKSGLQPHIWLPLHSPSTLAFLKDFIIYVYYFKCMNANVYVCVLCACIAQRGQKRVLGSPGLGLHIVASWHVGTGNWTWVLWKISQLSSAISSTPDFTSYNLWLRLCSWSYIPHYEKQCKVVHHFIFLFCKIQFWIRPISPHPPVLYGIRENVKSGGGIHLWSQQRQVDLWVQDSQGYAEKPLFQQTKRKEKKSLSLVLQMP